MAQNNKSAPANKKKNTGNSTKSKTASSAGKKTSSSKSSNKSLQPVPSAKTKKTMNDIAKQKLAVILFATAALLLAVTVFRGENIWLAVHNFFFGLFGITAFLWPVMLVYVAIVISKNCSFLSAKGNLIGSSAFIILLSSIIHVFAYDSVPSLKEQIVAAWDKGSEITFQSGGVLGALVGGIPYILFGKTAASIFLIIVLIAVFMLLTGTTLISIGMFFKDLKTRSKAKVEQLSQKSYDDTDDFNIDDIINADSSAKTPAPKKKNPFNAGNLSVEKDFSQDGTMIIDELVGNQKKSSSGSNYKLPKPFVDVNTGEVISNSSDDIESLLKKGKAYPKENGKANQLRNSDEFFDGNKSDNSKTDNKKPAKEGVPSKDLDILKINKDTGKDSGSSEKNESAPFKVYVKPGPDCLKFADNINVSDYEEELKEKATKLVETLNSFSVSTKIVGISRGPSVTRYELQPAAGVKISKITSLADDIALALASSGVRIEAPIPNKSAVGIEVPNKNRATVSLKEIVETPVFKNAKSKLNVALGKDITGNTICADIDKMPHLLIAGTTGSGKSVCLNSMIVSILMNATPDEVKLVMIDPKQVEFKVYNGIPHLLVPVVADPRKAAGALGWAVAEMLQRYKLFSDYNVRDIKGYNKLCQTNVELTPLPRIAIFIDELSDLMMVAPNEVEDSICRLAQMARAAGMHLIIATQRPSVNVITGIIKANIPSRIALSVSSQIDSRTILDTAGAEKLLGNGDMLFSPVGTDKPVRIQGCFLSDEEVETVVNFIKKQSDDEVEYDKTVIEEIEKQATLETKKPSSASLDNGDDEINEYGDEMVPKAIEVVVEAQLASTTLLQRKLKLGYARAARIIDTLEEMKVIGPYEGSKPRKVLYTKEQWYEMNALRSMPIENPLVTDSGSDEDDNE